MNNISRYIANLYLVMLNVRDTLEFCIDREHPIAIYNGRKRAIEDGLKEHSALKNFLDNNGDKGKEIQEKLKLFLDDIYGDGSSVLTITGDTVRVDHTQHIKIYDYVVGLNETLRDVIYSYINYARKNNQLEDVIVNLIQSDERLYRGVLNKWVTIDFEKAFVEFNKVMNESKGQATPQSNFIVQNEIAKLQSFDESSSSSAISDSFSSHLDEDIILKKNSCCKSIIPTRNKTFFKVCIINSIYCSIIPIVLILGINIS